MTNPLRRRTERASHASRRRRARWQARFRPDQVRLLLVAEAPPAASDRYFYFPTVGQHDSLFRYVVRLLLGVEPSRANKIPTLARLRDLGVYLVDVSQNPIAEGDDYWVETLIRRVSRLDPDHVILIKATVFDRCYVRLASAGLPVVNVRVPFPGSGQQAKFETAFRRALRMVGWRRPAQRREPDVYVSSGVPEPEIPGGCRVTSVSTGQPCRNPGRHVIDDVITCTIHRKAIERAHAWGAQ